jgi:hypothetical protein
MQWYEPKYYGELRGVPVSVMGWASNPNNELVACIINGTSTAIRGMIAQMRKGEQIVFVPKFGSQNIYAKTMINFGRGVTENFKFDLFPKSPQIMPNGDIQHLVVRRENPDISKHVCYVNDSKAKWRFLSAVRSVTDYPIHDDWAEWMIEQGARRKYWGVCNPPRIGSWIEIKGSADLGESQYGMQFRYVYNRPEAWQDVIIEGLKFKHISLPKE